MDPTLEPFDELFRHIDGQASGAFPEMSQDMRLAIEVMTSQLVWPVEQVADRMRRLRDRRPGVIAILEAIINEPRMAGLLVLGEHVVEIRQGVAPDERERIREFILEQYIRNPLR